jgi:hypothetical protein
MGLRPWSNENANLVEKNKLLPSEIFASMVVQLIFGNQEIINSHQISAIKYGETTIILLPGVEKSDKIKTL